MPIGEQIWQLTGKNRKLAVQCILLYALQIKDINEDKVDYYSVVITDDIEHLNSKMKMKMKTRMKVKIQKITIYFRF